jgi:poly(3-hydroxybutyrate) depolymerase
VAGGDSGTQPIAGRAGEPATNAGGSVGVGGSQGEAGAGGAAGGPGGASGGAGAAAVPSAGCGSKTTAASGRFTIDVSGTSRDYIIKLPDGYDANHPYRLIFGWHGKKYDATWVATGGDPLTGPYFGLESEAKGSAIFVAPQALSSGFGTSDLTFVDAMVAKFETELCIDKGRIFSSGFSMGAMMTITIACSRSDVFRAIAPMSGSLGNGCPAGGHVAYWASHGTNDTTIPIADGQKARDEFVKRNHCTSQTVALAREGCIAYQGCDVGYPVTWCTFAGVHEPAPFAGPAIWEFLSPL